MSQNNDTHTGNRVSTDPATVKSWADTHTLVPVRRERDGDHRLDIIPESEVHSDHEELSWDEFHRELQDRNMTVSRRGEGPEHIEVVDRSEVIGRATVHNEAAEKALAEGGTVESEVTERKVVEHVIVEEATVQSEVVDREVVESDIVDVELLTTDVQECAVTRAEPPTESATEVSWFQPGAQLEDPYDVEIDVDEEWAITRDVVERLTIESRIVDTDVEETETVETDTMRETVDIEGVTETILEGELVESPETAQDAVQHGRVESQFREDDTIETHLLRRQTIEEEMSVSKEIFGQVSDAETVRADSSAHTVIDSEIVEEAEYDVDLAAAVAASETESETTTTETATDSTDDEVRVRPTEDDTGKTVVNPSGEEIGMVVDVEGGEMYVDPHPSVTDRIRTVLGWSEHDDDSYLLGTDHIDRIEDDKVVLSVEHEQK